MVRGRFDYASQTLRESISRIFEQGTVRLGGFMCRWTASNRFDHICDTTAVAFCLSSKPKPLRFE